MAMGYQQVKALRETAAGQDAQFATAQAREGGVTRHQIATMHARGEIENRRSGVWRFTAAAGDADPAVTAMLACWPNGVISHQSAAVFHGLVRVKLPVEPSITVPHREVHELPGITLHRSRWIQDCDVLQVGNVRYTGLPRTLCDLADPKELWETLSLLDDAVAGGAKRTWINHRAADLANGRAGARIIRDATSEEARALFNSWLERASAHVFRAGGLPDPQWNVDVRDARGRIGIVDALWLPWRVVAEMEGLRFHTTPQQRRRDATRFNRMLDARYQPRRFTWEDIVHRPLEVVTTLYGALNAAGADLDPARIPNKIVLPTRPFL
jgi:hypothetical protein